MGDPPPLSMHSGLLPQDNPAGARARAHGLGYQESPRFGVNRGRGGAAGQGGQRPGDAQSEVRPLGEEYVEESIGGLDLRRKVEDEIP